MTTYAVTALRWDNGQVVAAMMGEVKKEQTVFSAEPVHTQLIEVVDKIRGGDTVVLSFPGALPGPGLRVETLADGMETIEAMPSELPNKTLADMPTY